MTNALKFRISRIETKQFACFPEDFINGETVNIKADFGFDVNDTHTEICCFSKYVFDQNGKKLVAAEVFVFFSIHPDSALTLREDHTIVIPVDNLRHFATIAVGTARGIIWSKTEGTCLNQVVLPPINLVETITNDFIKPIE